MGNHQPGNYKRALLAVVVILASSFSSQQFTEATLLIERSNTIPRPLIWLIPTLTITIYALGSLIYPDSEFSSSISYVFAFTLIAISSQVILQPDWMFHVWFLLTSSLLGLFAFYVPERVLRGNEFNWKDNLSTLLNRTLLIRVWTKNIIQAQYSQSLLGIAWVMLLPLAEASIMGFAFAVLLGRGEVAGKPFMLFLLSGIVIYNVFSRVVSKNLTSLLGSMGVIKQIYFPREIVLITTTGEVLVNFAFSLVTLLIVNIILGSLPGLSYFALPLALLPILAIGLGTAFFTSFGNLLFRDLQQLIPLILQLLFYVTVLFSLRIVTDQLAVLGLINPLTAAVEFFREIVVYESNPDFATLVFPSILGFLLLYSGYIFFKVNEDRLIDFA